MADNILNISQGDSVNFGDSSIGDIVGYSWNFPGGTPTGSTSDSPSVTYTNIGNFDVSLTTEDAYGVFSTNIKTGIIQVSEAPWGVSFTISESPVLLGSDIDLTNTSIGTATYNEWTFPTDGIISSGLTSGGSISVNGLKYMNWMTLTGSHADPAGTIFTGNVKLFASGDFNLGSDTQLMNIRKLGAEEFYREVYDYSLSSTSRAGSIDSTVYGSVNNQSPTTGATSIGLTYSFVTDPLGVNVAEYEVPTYSSDGSVIPKVSFGDDYASTYWRGSIGPTGLAYPHVQGERAEITGRAFSAFNIKNTSYIANNDNVYAALGGLASGKTIGTNISSGKYTSDIKVPAPGVNEVVNPNFALIADNYKVSGVADFSRSYLTYYSKPVDITARDSVGTVYIPKPTIDKLFEHPVSLPNPGSTEYPTIGITTSADIHLSSDQRINNINGYARTYVDTAAIQTLKASRGAVGMTNIGRYPGIPSQYILPRIPSTSYLSLESGSIYGSSYPPMGLRIKVYYSGRLENEIDVYFGLPDAASRGARIIDIPDSLNPDRGGSGANAYGNDATNGSWILAEDTVKGIGVASYINAYINDPSLGLRYGTDELIAKVDDYYTLPTPYSNNNPGAITPISGTAYPGISIEIKNPDISKVELVEMYGMVRPGGYYGDFFYNHNGEGDSLLMTTPITWDFGRTVPPGQSQNLPPYIDDPADWADTPSSFLGISSRIIPFSSGPLGYGALGTFGTPNIDKSTGIKIGGSLKT